MAICPDCGYLPDTPNHELGCRTVRELMSVTSFPRKTVSEEGVTAVLSLHHATVHYTTQLPYEFVATCTCGWEGDRMLHPVNLHDVHIVRERIRESVNQHIAKMIMEEGAA